MHTQSLDSIAHFCIDQYSAFDANAWIRRGTADAKLVAVAAKYLSMTSWFGNKAALERIATQIDADMASSTKFNRELRAIGLDHLAFFSETVRCGITAEKLSCPSIRARRQQADVAATLPPMRRLVQA